VFVDRRSISRVTKQILVALPKQAYNPYQISNNLLMLDDLGAMSDRRGSSIARLAASGNAELA
jgi:hypothetical protein